MDNAASVISFFFPITKAVCQSNDKPDQVPSALWLHSRFEGQQFLNQFCQNMKSFLTEQGVDVIVPSQDERFTASESGTFTSNWSERHVAYACGLGTFGLSRGLITRRGVAGRFCSFIISAVLEPTGREYQNHEEYCSFCGACIKRCPAGAITMEKGKDHELCAEFVHKTREIYSPRYGCGKCQVRVPCEKGVPAALRRS